MKRLTTHFLIVHTLVISVSAVIVWVILKFLFPDDLNNIYVLIPIFFLMIGWSFILFARKVPEQSPKKIINIYMLVRMLKLFLSIIFFVLYLALDNENIRSFAIVFIIFFLIYLGVETYIYIKIEMYIKQQEKLKKEWEERSYE